MREKTLGQRWVQFLRGYTPTTQNDSMITEKVAKLAKHHKIEPIKFEHPLEKKFRSLIFDDKNQIRDPNELTNVILTGTAGDGKTALCYSLWKDIFGTPIPIGSHASLKKKINGKEVEFTFIFDFSAYFKVSNDGDKFNKIKKDLEAFTSSVFTTSHELRYFIIAINDGQFSELWRNLPQNSPILKLEPLITELHASNQQCNSERLHFFNLSTIPTPELFKRAYGAILERPEWDDCFIHNPLEEFSKDSPLYNNYQALRSSEYKTRLFQLTSLCDACHSHVPIRELLMWVANGLLGLQGAPQGVARLKELRSAAKKKSTYDAALHRNIFGENLSASQRGRFAIFRFLSGIKLGQETINDLDELIIFGDKLKEFEDAHSRLISADPYGHRSKDFALSVQNYINGEGDEHSQFLKALVEERRRIFFSADSKQLENALGGQSIWTSSIFHNAELYLSEILTLDFVTEFPPVELVKKLVLGLNRVWTGLLTADADKLYVAKGLNYSSAAISDVLVFGVPVVDDFGEQKISIEKSLGGSLIPRFEIQWKDGEAPFSFELSLERFEFLSRVADGVMPNAFSRECWEDVITLKTKLLRRLYGSGLNPRQIKAIGTDSNGKITSHAIT